MSVLSDIGGYIASMLYGFQGSVGPVLTSSRVCLQKQLSGQHPDGSIRGLIWGGNVVLWFVGLSLVRLIVGQRFGM